MELTHSFTVPASVDETWAHFNDLEAVASCFPGATVTSVEGDAFKGSCKVKLGPISLVYAGSGEFLEKDEAGHRFVIEAKGKDKRGNGTAGATVTASMSSSGQAGTAVTVLTDLSITGKPAQFGRGVMQDVSDKLLQQFVACLESRLGGVEEAAPQGAEQPAAVPEQPSAAAPAPAKKAAAKKTAAKKTAAKKTAAKKTAEAPAAPPAAEAEAPAPEAVPPPVPPPVPTPEATTAAAMAASGDEAGGARPAVAAAGGPSYRPAGEEPENVLDLGTTVLPVLAKAYWKQALGALLVLLLLGWLLRSRRHRRHR